MKKILKISVIKMWLLITLIFSGLSPMERTAPTQKARPKRISIFGRMAKNQQSTNKKKNASAKKIPTQKKHQRKNATFLNSPQKQLKQSEVPVKPFTIIDTSAITNTIKNNIDLFIPSRKEEDIEKYIKVDTEKQEILFDEFNFVLKYKKPISDNEIDELIRTLPQQKIKAHYKLLAQKIDPVTLLTEFAQLITANYPFDEDEGNFFYCDCSSAFEGQRLSYALELLNEIVQKQPNTEKNLVHVELAARGNMQDLIHLYGLIKLGYTNLTYIIINPETITQEGEETSLVQKNVDRLKTILDLQKYPEIKITLFEYGQNYSDAVKNNTAPRAHSFSMVDPENDYDDEFTLEDYISGMRTNYDENDQAVGTEKVNKEALNIIDIDLENISDKFEEVKTFEGLEGIEILISKFSNAPHIKFFTQSKKDNYPQIEKLIKEEFNKAFSKKSETFIDKKLNFFEGLQKATYQLFKSELDFTLFQGFVEDAFYEVIKTTKAVDDPVILSLKIKLINFTRDFSFGPEVIYHYEQSPSEIFYDEVVEPLINKKEEELGWGETSEHISKSEEMHDFETHPQAHKEIKVIYPKENNSTGLKGLLQQVKDKKKQFLEKN